MKPVIEQIRDIEQRLDQVEQKVSRLTLQKATDDFFSEVKKNDVKPISSIRR